MIEKTLTANLLAIADAFCAATGRTITGVSKEFYGKAEFFDKLRDGTHTVSIKKLDEMVNAFRAKWPDGTPWPKVDAVHMKR